MAEPTISLDEAGALMDKMAAEEAAKKKKEKKVKKIVVDGYEQGRGGLGIHTKNLLEKIDD
jgi:hypothetical protein